ncbi:MAG: restriction endonuclease, partial [Erysipelotrichaceae bacterium]|nr:restriction endonuclease [Erysipelotrichaceae bacterium]
MKETKTVREFDTIICNENYKDDPSYQYIDQKRFNDLTTFIHEFTSNNEADVLDFLRIGFKRSVGPTITFKNYVGIIQMKDGFQLEILPKIDLSEDEDNKRTKKIFVNMLRSMKDFPSKVFTSANLNIDKMNLYEIFISM